MRAFTLKLMVLALFLSVAAARAQVAPPETPAKVLTLHPAAEPVPALKYRLLSIYVDQEPGNAAAEYKELAQELDKGPFQWDVILFDTWRQVPLQDLPVQEVRQALEPLKPYLERLAQAARREKCDWERPIRGNLGGIRLAEVNACREFARLLTLKARLHMAEGRFNEAVEALQTGFTLARHVSEGPTLIESLVAITIAHITAEQVEAFVQAPGAPNLYWPLTALPRPLVGTRTPMEMEINGALVQWPRLKELTRPGLTSDEARAIVEKVFADLQQIGQMPRADNLGGKLAVTGLAMACYVPARQYLLEQGWPHEKVEAMPVLQVVGIHFSEGWQRLADERLKWFYVPYPEAREALEKVEYPRLGHNAGMGEMLFAMWIPALTGTRLREAKLDRRVAALRCVEAVRMYAAAHDGRLPMALSDITEVPIPENPMTGESFDYEVVGNRAVLSAPLGEGERPAQAIHYELAIAEEPELMED